MLIKDLITEVDIALVIKIYVEAIIRVDKELIKTETVHCTRKNVPREPRLSKMRGR